MLPDLNNCDFFKKTTLFDGGKSEKAFIFKLKSDTDYSFVFTCPKCGVQNDFKDQLVLKEIKNGRKKQKYIAFNCKKCSAGFMAEKFKVKKARAGKKEGV